MKLQHGFDAPSAYRGGFVSIGNFDGVHRGHQAMITTLVSRARSSSVPAVVLTFNPHPITLLRPQETPPSLSTLEEKVKLLAQHGVDCVIAYPTNPEFLQLTADEFFEQMVRRELQARGLVEGPNFFFGRDRAGDVKRLREMCDRSGLTLDVVSPVHVDGQLVSSSKIRRHLMAGGVEQATLMLGRNYSITGTVTQGAVRGRTLGFPTANLRGIPTLLPADGVYAGIAWPNGIARAAAVHIGANPTFGELQQKVEVHIIDFSGDLYDSELTVDFLARLRATSSFGDAAALQMQLAEDIARAKAVAEAAMSG